MVFTNVVAFQYTSAQHCTPEQVGAYDTVKLVSPSPWAANMIGADDSIRHYRVYFDNLGCYEVLARAFIPPPESGAFSEAENNCPIISHLMVGRNLPGDTLHVSLTQSLSRPSEWVTLGPSFSKQIATGLMANEVGRSSSRRSSATEITDLSRLSEMESFVNILRGGQWLHTGYREVSPARYLSRDGERVVRYGAHETRSATEHIHLEAYENGFVVENTWVESIP